MCARDRRVSSPVGLTGRDANVTIGYSRSEVRVDLGYARATTYLARSGTMKSRVSL